MKAVGIQPENNPSPYRLYLIVVLTLALTKQFWKSWIRRRRRRGRPLEEPFFIADSELDQGSCS